MTPIELSDPTRATNRPRGDHEGGPPPGRTRDKTAEEIADLYGELAGRLHRWSWADRASSRPAE
jgi:hypothetical protein